MLDSIHDEKHTLLAIDVWLLFPLYECHEKRADLRSKKVQSQQITPALLDNDLFPAVLFVTQSCARSCAERRIQGAVRGY